MAEREQDERAKRTSELPVDLRRERETFVRQFIKRGIEVTESLLEENKSLQAQIARLEEQVTRLRSQVASDDAIRDLIRKIEALESERENLLERSTELEAVSQETADHTQEVERELHDLANLYIASSHLHSTLSVKGVLQHLHELLQQLVGAETYAIYLLSQDRTKAHPIGSDGVDLDAVPPIVPGEGLVGEVLMTGVARISAAPQPAGTLDAPIAALPLMLRDQPVGAIAIASVFEQKSQWQALDHELFSLLTSHAATALIAANLYASAPGPLPALDGLRDHLLPTQN